MWFKLVGDARLGRCASEGCGGQPTFRLEVDGVGSNYCSGCKEHIEIKKSARDGIGSYTDYDDHNEYDDGECWNCGGEGRVNHCIDGCCVDQDDIYCEYCSRRCDVCNPPTPKQVEEGNKLRQILAEALAQQKS